MLEKDPLQNYPSPEERAAIPGELLITRDDFQSEAVDDLLEALRTIYANGKAAFVSFFIDPHPILDYFAARDQLDEQQFWTKILSSPLLLDHLPWLGAGYAGSLDERFLPLSPYYFDGDLAQTLMKGGAYRRFSGMAAEAKELGLRFCADVFDNRFDEVLLRKSKDAWAEWFMVGPWDNTWLGLDRRARRLWLLCATDTD